MVWSRSGFVGVHLEARKASILHHIPGKWSGRDLVSVEFTGRPAKLRAYIIYQVDGLVEIWFRWSSPGGPQSFYPTSYTRQMVWSRSGFGGVHREARKASSLHHIPGRWSGRDLVSLEFTWRPAKLLSYIIYQANGLVEIWFRWSSPGGPQSFEPTSYT